MWGGAYTAESTPLLSTFECSCNKGEGWNNWSPMLTYRVEPQSQIHFFCLGLASSKNVIQQYYCGTGIAPNKSNVPAQLSFFWIRCKIVNPPLLGFPVSSSPSSPYPRSIINFQRRKSKLESLLEAHRSFVSYSGNLAFKKEQRSLGSARLQSINNLLLYSISLIVSSAKKMEPHGNNKVNAFSCIPCFSHRCDSIDFGVKKVIEQKTT